MVLNHYSGMFLLLSYCLRLSRFFILLFALILVLAVLGKNTPGKKPPPDSKPNPILTLPLTPHGGLFFRGDFFLTPVLASRLVPRFVNYILLCLLHCLFLTCHLSRLFCKLLTGGGALHQDDT